MLQGFFQIALTLIIVILLVQPFGKYMAQVFQEKPSLLDSIMVPVERQLYKIAGIRSQQNMTGPQYIRALLLTNLVMGIFVYLIFLLQGILPFNPTGLKAPSWDLMLHTVISFLTNTDQQHYSGETTYSYASQT